MSGPYLSVRKFDSEYGLSFEVCGRLWLFQFGIAGTVAVFCMLSVAIQACVIDKPGVLASLRRSRTLTRGHPGGIFVVMLVIGGISLVTLWLSYEVWVFEFWGVLVVSLLQQMLTGSLFAVMCGVIYYLLRAEREAAVLPCSQRCSKDAWRRSTLSTAGPAQVRQRARAIGERERAVAILDMRVICILTSRSRLSPHVLVRFSLAVYRFDSRLHEDEYGKVWPDDL